MPLLLPLFSVYTPINALISPVCNGFRMIATKFKIVNIVPCSLSLLAGLGPGGRPVGVFIGIRNIIIISHIDLGDVLMGKVKALRVQRAGANGKVLEGKRTTLVSLILGWTGN